MQVNLVEILIYVLFPCCVLINTIELTIFSTNDSNIGWWVIMHNPNLQSLQQTDI